MRREVGTAKNPNGTTAAMNASTQLHDTQFEGPTDGKMDDCRVMTNVPQPRHPSNWWLNALELIRIGGNVGDWNQLGVLLARGNTPAYIALASFIDLEPGPY
jgi:hypothetical protein